MNEIIKTDLQVNRSYVLNVTTRIYSLNVQTSDQQIFSEYLSIVEAQQLLIS